MAEVQKSPHDDKFIFVGRQHLLNEFYRLFSYRRQKNVLYFVGEGGYGKSWLLRKIRQDNQYRHRIIPEVIDFYELKHRTIPGLREAIAARLEKETYFSRYLEAEAERRALLGTSQPERLVLAAAEQKVNNAFFGDLGRALAGREVVLLFDTFEMAQDKAVGAWFLEEFLSAARSAIVGIAGRRQKLSPPIPYRVIQKEVGKFEINESKELCREMSRKYDRGELMPSEIEKLHNLVQGNPLKIALFYQTRAVLRELETYGPPDLDRKLMESFSDERDRRNLLYHYMAYLRRRFTDEILEILIREDPRLREIGYAEAQATLNRAEWVKPLPGGAFALHDIFRDLLVLYAMPRLFSEEDLIGPKGFNAVVNGWYPQKVAAPNTGEDDRRLLMAEQVGYMLERDKVLLKRSGDDAFEMMEGAKQYETYFRKAKEQQDFRLVELLWSETFGHRDRFREKGYRLCRDQADWQYDTGQLSNAANLYRLMAKEYETPPTHRFYSLIRLSDVFLARGQKFDPASLPEQSMAAHLASHAQDLDYLELNNAHDAALKGEQEARRLHDVEYESIFLHRQGVIVARLGRWTWAQDRYKQALDKIRGRQAEQSREYRAQILLSQSELHARLGNYSEAENAAGSALRIRRELMRQEQAVEVDTKKKEAIRRKRSPLIADALIYKAQAMRYDDQPFTAEDIYRVAVQEVQDLTEDRPFYCRLLQDRGTNYYAIGVSKRLEVDNLEEDIVLQIQAARDIQEAIGIARDSKLSSYVPRALRRLGRVFEELALLEKQLEVEQQGGDAARAALLRERLVELQQECGRFQLQEEDRWRDVQRLIDGPAFKELDNLGKAQRLFEVGFLEADDIDDYHDSLDGLQEAADVARLRKRPADIEHYAEQVKYLRGYDVQETLFSALIDLTGADTAFDQGHYDEALEVYCKKFPVLGEEGGYGAIQWKTRLRELENDLRATTLSPSQRVEWCERLIQCWEDRLPSAETPEARRGLIEMIDRVRAILDVLQSLSEE